MTDSVIVDSAPNRRSRGGRACLGLSRGVAADHRRRELKAGRHTPATRFEETGDVRTRMGRRIADLWVPNDASFVPPGYVCQVMFQRPAPW